MARAREALLTLDPGHTASKMCTFSMYGQEAAVIEPGQVKPAISERRDATGLESFYRSGNSHTSPIDLWALTPAGH